MFSERNNSSDEQLLDIESPSLISEANQTQSLTNKSLNINKRDQQLVDESFRTPSPHKKQSIIRMNGGSLSGSRRKKTRRIGPSPVTESLNCYSSSSEDKMKNVTNDNQTFSQNGYNLSVNFSFCISRILI